MLPNRVKYYISYFLKLSENHIKKNFYSILRKFGKVKKGSDKFINTLFQGHVAYVDNCPWATIVHPLTGFRGPKKYQKRFLINSEKIWISTKRF
jgi:hypothetical protein